MRDFPLSPASSTKRFAQFVGLLASAALTVGCADESPAASSSTQQGVTVCGDLSFNGATCQPGQYCEQPQFGTCSNGCLADTNCASNQVCDLDGGSPGTCVNTTATPTPTPNPNPNPTPTPTGDVARCEAACDALLTCGAVTNTELATCKTGCGLDASVAKLVADCVEAGADCNAKAQCLGDNPGGGGNASCKEVCDDAGFFDCEDAPALTPTEVATCNASCDTKSEAEQMAMENCWDAAFFNCTTAGARACFAGWL